MISVGFLAHPVSINGVHFVLRSLLPGDLFLLQYRITSDSDTDWKVWSVASSIWMVNGHCLVGDVQVVPRMADVVRKLPGRARDILFSLMMGLFSRQARALDGVEAYCYETVSRYRWKSYGGQAPTTHSGIPGIDRLGTNHIQRMWTFYNEIEDRKQHDDAMWEGFKLAASAQAPKGVRKIDQKDQKNRQIELDRRRTVQDRYYYQCLGILKKDSKVSRSEDGDLLVAGTKSPEELAEEMYNWITGKEDFHDKIVNDYKKRIVERYQAEKQERERRAALLRQRLENEENASLPLVGYTPDQLADILKGRQMGRPSTIKTVYGSQHGNREYLYEKYLEKPPDAGVLKVEDGKLYVQDEHDLANQIALRNVPFSYGPEEEE